MVFLSMAHADFVHLRVHSAYSLSEGAIPVKTLVELCVDKKMPAAAITDTNNLFGALEFAGAAAKAGVQPIIGCQLSITRERASEQQGTSSGSVAGPDADPIILLAQNDAGYRNLLKLISLAYLGEADAAEPPVDPQVPVSALDRHSDGLIALTGGPAGPVGHLLLNGQIDAARDLMEKLNTVFPNRLYIELMRHGLEEERRTEPLFLDLAYDLDLPIVATNECFFTDGTMHEAHDALICIAEGTYLSETDRRRLTPDHGFKPATEMRALFADLPEAVDNTMVIAKRTAFMVESIDPILPPYDCGENRSEEDELRSQAAAGLEARLEADVFTTDMNDEKREHAADPYRRRLDYELKVIADMGYPGYFLIVADFIRWSKEQGIPVGPGRGSGAGSVVAWSLTVTDLDPLRFGLLFERFLNPERVSMPDFDIDFCQDRRDEVIRYVQEKYGRDHVAQIITFGKLQARAVLRDVGRVLEMAYGYVDKICKLVPSNPANPPTLDEALVAEPQLRAMRKDDPQVDKLISIGLKLEGLYRHASTHAAGVVIGDRPLDELIPLYRDPRSDMPVSGFSMKYVEAAGLVKFDFLGLKTLTVLSKTEQLIRESGQDIDISKIPLDDKPTFEMIARGDTTGVFQLESSGMVQVLKSLRPDAFEDIIAVVALYRPGPMDNIPSYIKRKHGEEEPDYLYPTLEGILKETFGIMIYQEQVMQIAQELSGYSLGGADLLRRAMGKKIKSEMEQQRQVFISGAVAKGVPEEKASTIFNLVNKFAGYGFNKSHAAAYALVAYQTAYMKANYPVEFMAVSMTLDLGNTDKLSVFNQELQSMGVEVRGSDINASGAVFTVERGANGQSGGVIRYALGAIKNVGEAAMEKVVQERSENGPFKDLFDFAGRLDPHVVNKRQMENLARAGAFDSLCPNRRQAHGAIEMLLKLASIAHRERDSGQIGLFGGDAEGAPVDTPSLPEISDWTKMDRLDEEFDATGLYLSGHPLDDYGTAMKRLKVKTQANITQAGKTGAKRMAGTLQGISERTSKKGNRYAFLSFTDTSGVFEAICFSEILSDKRDILEAGNSFYIHAQYDAEEGRFSVNGLQLLEKAADSAVPGLAVVVETEKPLRALRDILADGSQGRGQVLVISRLEEGSEVELELKGSYSLTPEMINAVRAIPGIVETREI
jgi:DNA polymerase-3 subunit alpha